MQLTKVALVITTPWKKYNDYFDKNSHGIWGLPTILKFTLLGYFLIFLPPIFALVKFENSYDTVVLIFFLTSMAIWALYLPIFFIFVAVKAYKRTLWETRKFIKSKPLEFTPKRLYLQPHSLVFIHAIVLKNYLIDFLDWCTQFFPFELIFPNKIRYPLTMKIRHTAQYIESIFAYLKIPLKFARYEINMQYTVYKFEFYEKVKNIEKVIEKFEKKVDWTDFYIRREDNLITIVDPHREK